MIRARLIQADAAFLIVASAFGLVADLMSYAGAGGPFRDIFLANPLTIGVVEAHGLALIAGLSAIGWPKNKLAHLNLALIHALLGGANIAFFDVFRNVEAVNQGIAITGVHFLFAVGQVIALCAAAPAGAAEARASA